MTAASPYTDPVEEKAIRLTPFARIASRTLNVTMVFCSVRAEPHIRVRCKVKDDVDAARDLTKHLIVQQIALDKGKPTVP